jgi:hypothetical protein
MGRGSFVSSAKHEGIRTGGQRYEVVRIKVLKLVLCKGMKRYETIEAFGLK